MSDRGWFDQLSDKYVSSIPLGRVASPPTSSAHPVSFRTGCRLHHRAGPASERRQVDPLKVEDRYAAARASVFDGTTAGYLPGLFAAFERANARILSDLDWQLNVPYGRDARETFDLCRASARRWDRAVFMADTGSRATSRSFASWQEHGPKPASMSPWQGIACVRTSPCAISPRASRRRHWPSSTPCRPRNGTCPSFLRATRRARIWSELALAWKTQPGDARRGRGHQRHIRSDAAGARR